MYKRQGLERVVTALRVIAPELPFPIICRELSQPEEHISIAGYEITAFRVKHNVVCYGYTLEIPRAGKFDPERAKKQEIPMMFWNRLQKGETIESEGRTFTPDMVLGEARKGLKVTYCTDTRPVPVIARQAQGADLFVCEGMYGEPDKDAKAREYKHMTFKEAVSYTHLDVYKRQGHGRLGLGSKGNTLGPDRIAFFQNRCLIGIHCGNCFLLSLIHI